MLIEGTTELNGGVVSSHNDHRIAMAAAVAGLKADKELIITGADAVNKSYPQFWEHIKSLGAKVSLTDN
jgi:3-phosphoshikimate 1-carboxyvinyltransferase